MTFEDLRKSSSLFEDLGDREFDLLTALARPLSVEQGTILFRADDPASRFYFVSKGLVALRITTRSKPTMTIQTLGEGSLLGLSWRVPPYRWQWTAQAKQDSELIEFDANHILAACEQDHELDSAMWEMVAKEASKRLQHVRMQLLDIYGRETS
mgnify:CR=1 FL=1